MTTGHDIDALRSEAGQHPRPGILAKSRVAGGNAGVQGIPSPRVPAERVGVARPRRPPQFPQADGRFARAGGRQRVHPAAERGARAVRAPAGGARARQAAVLRDRDADEWGGNGAPRREPRRAPDENRGESGSSFEPRRNRRLCAGGDSWSLRPRSVTDPDQSRRHSSL